MSDDVNDIPYKPMPPNQVHKGKLVMGGDPRAEGRGGSVSSFYCTGCGGRESTTGGGCARCGMMTVGRFYPPAPAMVYPVVIPVPTKELTDGELASRELIAALRGYAGKLRAQIVMAKAVLEWEGTDASKVAVALLILIRALEIPSPDDPDV